MIWWICGIIVALVALMELRLLHLYRDMRRARNDWQEVYQDLERRHRALYEAVLEHNKAAMAQAARIRAIEQDWSGRN